MNKDKFKAILCLDNKGMWRVKSQNRKPKDKGEVVPQSLRNRFQNTDNNKSVDVIKIDGQIKQVLFEGEKEMTIYETPKAKTAPSINNNASPNERKESHDSNNDNIDYTAYCNIVAYKCAENAKNLGKDYKNYAKSLPMMIRANGLGATLAFLKSKDKSKEIDEHFQKLYEHLGGYLQTKHKALHDNDVAEAIVTLSSSETKELTKEALTFLGWLRRFAEGLITK